MGSSQVQNIPRPISNDPTAPPRPGLPALCSIPLDLPILDVSIPGVTQEGTFHA